MPATEPVPTFRQPPASVYRVEFSEAVRTSIASAAARQRLAWAALGVMVVLVGLALVLGGTGQLVHFVGYGVMALVVGTQAWRLRGMPREAAAVRVDRLGLDLWSPTGAHLTLPSAAVESVRAGQLGIGLTLSPDASPAMAGVSGLGTRAGRRFAAQLADPTASPYIDSLGGYDRAGFTAAVARLSGGRVRVTG